MDGVALLDVNMLLALVYTDHEFHAPAHEWFSRNALHGWATCPLTESAFVRLSAQKAVVGTAQTIESAVLLSEQLLEHPHHHFWPQPSSLLNMSSAVRSRLRGHRQITDAILLDLAMENSGRLVTTDHGIRKSTV